MNPLWYDGYAFVVVQTIRAEELATLRADITFAVKVYAVLILLWFFVALVAMVCVYHSYHDFVLPNGRVFRSLISCILIM